MSTRDKVLSCILALLLLAVIGTIVGVIHTPPIGEQFTEFYFLGVEGEAKTYPKELVVGGVGKVLVGIVNHEYQEMSYQVVVRIDGMEHEELGPVVLEHGEEWQQEVSFVVEKAGKKREVEFLLFKGGDSEPYNSLLLLLDVVEKG